MGQFSNPVATHPRTNEVGVPPPGVEEFRFCGAASRVDEWIIILAYQVISSQRANVFNFMLPALLSTANWVNGSSHQQILEARTSHMIVKKDYT